MFWKFNSPSSVQIDALLQKEDVTLQELMEEEELLQECKVQNKKLIEYLTQPEVLERLVDLVVSDPPQEKELEVRFKHANLASELLTCDVPIIVDKVASSTNLLLMLYKFLEKEKPLNPLLASFVSKVFGMLVQRRSEQVLDFLKSKGEFVQVVVRHIGTSAIMDLLSKLICGVDNDDQDIRRGIHEWLNDCGLIEQLVEKLSPDCDSEEHSSVDQLIQEIIITSNDPASNGFDSSNSSQSRLLITLESKELVNKLMDTLLHEDRNESSVSHVINILLKLLSSKSSNKQSSLHHTSSIGSTTDDSVDSTNTVLRTIIDRLPELQKILVQPTKLGEINTSYGMAVERLGSTRLQVVNLIAALIETNNLEVHSKLASLATVNLLLDLFFKFSLNNFLHTQVTVCITIILCQPLTTLEKECDEETEDERKLNPIPDQDIPQVIDGRNNNPIEVDTKVTEITEQELEPIKEFSQEDIIEKKLDTRPQSQETDPTKHPLLKQLFTECGIVQKILEVYNKNNSNMEQKVSHNLIGYMGHLREIANTIVGQSKEGLNSVIINKLLKELPSDVQTEWEDFEEVALAVENLKNKVIPIQIIMETIRKKLHMANKRLLESDDDSDEDYIENFIPCPSLVITNQSYKESEMDPIADLRFNDNDFKDTEEHLSGALQRLTSQSCAATGGASGPSIEESSSDSVEMFEEACSQRFSFDISTFDDMWKFKEKNITFGSFNKAEEEEASHSSSEEEGDLDNEFDSLRSTEEKMEVDFVPETAEDWSEIFDKRRSSMGVEEEFNPWQSAPASDTADNNSWADFGASSPFDPFGRPTATGAVPPPSSAVVGEAPAFQAAFSDVLHVQSISRSPPTNDFQAPHHQGLQDICDSKQPVENIQDTSTTNNDALLNTERSDQSNANEEGVVDTTAVTSLPSTEIVSLNTLQPIESTNELIEDKPMDIVHPTISEIEKHTDSNTSDTNA